MVVEGLQGSSRLWGNEYHSRRDVRGETPLKERRVRGVGWGEGARDLSGRSL